jgi:hypothetical protein
MIVLIRNILPFHPLLKLILLCLQFAFLLLVLLVVYAYYCLVFSKKEIYISFLIALLNLDTPFQMLQIGKRSFQNKIALLEM